MKQCDFFTAQFGASYTEPLVECRGMQLIDLINSHAYNNGVEWGPRLPSFAEASFEVNLKYINV